MVATIAYRQAEPSMLSKASIFSLAESVATQIGYVPGTDLHSAVSRLGGTIRVEDTLAQDPTRSGSLYVEADDRFTIVVPSHTAITRDAFTIAHELGHYVVHYLWRKRNAGAVAGPMMALRKGSDRLEWEANWFAAAFLMPEAPFKASFLNQGLTSALAKEYGVSLAAATIRAKQLGLA